MINNEYLQLLDLDKDIAIKYFTKSIVKTEQQKALEKKLPKLNKKVLEIADIACGGGTLSYHLKSIFPNSKFSLLDFCENGIERAKEINPEKKFSFFCKDMFKSGFADDKFDFVFSWQTLGWIESEDAPKMLNELIRITKPGGKIFLSSLFNLDFDVDIISKVFDYTRPSGKAGKYSNYNTYCKKTLQKWIGNKVTNFKIHKFSPLIDFKKTKNRGLATFTRKTKSERLQISGGMLLNWGILEIRK